MERNEYKKGRPLFKEAGLGAGSKVNYLAAGDKEDEIDDDFEDVKDEDVVDTEEA